MAYTNGNGVPHDAQEALEWFRKAANQGNADAQIIIGIAYASGKITPATNKTAIEQNGRKAVDLSQKAADQRNKIAEYLLATAYAKDQSLPQEPEKAFMWAKKSAD